MPKTVYLVDASTFIHRGYHAIRGLSTREGRPTNAVYGFLATLNKVLREKSPEYLAVAYDAKGKSHRHDLYPEYKANRPPMPEDLIAQQEPIRKIVKALGLAGIEIEGLEADDIIATLTRQAVESGFEVVIVTGDKDFYQLLSDRVSMFDPNPKGDTALDVDGFAQRFAITPAGFLEAQGLMGDSTDNIPGIPGVGEKTALKLIQEYGTLESLYANLDHIPPSKVKEKLVEHRAGAFLSRDLARLKPDADLGLTLDDVKVAPADVNALQALYRELEFNRFLADLETAPKALCCDDYHLVDDEGTLEDLKREMAGVGTLSVDLETTSKDAMRARIVGVSLAARPQRAFYIPIGHETLGARQLPWDIVKPWLKELLESPTVRKVGQNIKYDYIVLRRAGIEIDPISGDPMIASYLIDPDALQHNLDRLALSYLNHTTIKYKEVVGSKQTGFENASPEAARDYACEDADVALILADLLRKKLEESELIELYETLEIPLIKVLAEMEMNGVRLNLPLLADLSKELAGRMNQSQERIFALAGRSFNINSTRQLGDILFEVLKLPTGKKTTKKSGFSTDVEVLTELAAQHELPAEVLNYRSLSKLRSTYVDALSQLIHPETGRVHTSFNQSVAATGRLSSSDPNLQNIPIRTEEGRRIRAAFIPAPGCKILSADYSQVELRILAHYSNDEKLQASFLSGEDIHTRTAAEVFGVAPGSVDGNLRRRAKAINFGIIYGQQAFGLARSLGIERAEAQAYIDAYFERYAGVKHFIEDTLARARKDGYVMTLMGRRRNLPALTGKNYQARSLAERMAVNTPIQGSAADIIKKAMLNLHRAIKDGSLPSKMILQVHDELVFEVPEADLDAMTTLVRDKMENVVALAVPLTVDISHGDHWLEAH